MKCRLFKIDFLKNVIIAVLFITAILLLSVFWKNSAFRDFTSLTGSAGQDNEFEPDMATLLQPAYGVVNYGTDSYSRENPDEIYSFLLATMNSYFSDESVREEEIEKSQYDEVMSYPSVMVDFGYNIPFDDFLGYNSITVPSVSYSLSSVTSIGISADYSENILIYDGSAGRYYRFVTDDTEKSANMSQQITDIIDSSEAEAVSVYYTMSSLVGVDNDTLIPLYTQTEPQIYTFSDAFSISDNKAVSNLETMFFPSGLDFVRKITENRGTLLYTYGLSEKVLVLGEDGRIEYAEETDSSQYSDISFYDGLETACDYIKSHGGWTDLFEGGASPYISRAESITDDSGRRGYRFEFSIKLGDFRVMGEDPMITVEVYGSQVTRYARDAIVVGDETESGGQEMVDAIDIITDRYSEICDALYDKAAADNDDKAMEDYTSKNDNRFDIMAKNIDGIGLCNFRSQGTEGMKLVPAWYISIDDSVFWCDLFSGELIGSDTGEEGQNELA